VEAEGEKVKQGTMRFVITKNDAMLGSVFVFVSPWLCYFAIVVKRVAESFISEGVAAVIRPK